MSMLDESLLLHGGLKSEGQIRLNAPTILAQVRTYAACYSAGALLITSSSGNMSISCRFSFA